jgi:hypothetical protein
MQDIANKIIAAAIPVPYDRDAPVVKELRRLGYIDLRTLMDDIDEAHSRTNRAHVRYLAALMPELSLNKLSSAITGIISNNNLIERDVRLILEGRSLWDPTRRTREVALEAIQTIGRSLSAGKTREAAARAAGVSLNTVEAIDNYLGLSTAYADKLFSSVVDCVRDGLSVRETAKFVGVSRSRAHRLVQRAREVLVEIGEVVK